MLELGVGIKVDPADSVSKADAATAALHRTEDQGIAAGKAMYGLAGSFKSLSTAMQQQQQAMERLNGVQDRLERQNRPIALGFAKIAEAIQREQQMLELIHAPMNNYMNGLNALDKLLERGKISTSEYADQVRRLNHEIDGAPKAANSNVPAAATGSPLGGLRSAAGALGVSVGVGEIGALANEYQTLENRLRYLAGGDMAKVNSLFGQLQGVAQRTRGDLSATVESFTSVSLATKNMGLSTNQTLAFTERLNKAVALSGASGAAASAGMIQLAQGLAAGALRGDEFNSVMEQIPVVADVIGKSLGVTRGELRKMSQEGKITADVIVNAFDKAGASLDKDFANTVPTISQSFTAFKNEIVVMVGEFDKSTGASKLFGEAMTGAMAVLKAALVPLQLVGSALNAIGVSGGMAAGAIAGIALGGPLGAVAGLTIALAAQHGAFDDVTGAATAMMGTLGTLDALQTKLNTAVISGGKAMQGAMTEMVAYNLQLSLGAEVADAFSKALKQTTTVPLSPVDAVETGKAIDEFEKLGEANATWFTALDETHKRAMQMGIERSNDVTKARAELAALDAAHAQGTKTGALYRQEREHLLQVINGTTAAQGKGTKALDDYQRLLHEILGPQKDAIRDLNALGQLYMNGAINLEQYNNATAKRRDLLLELGILETKSVTNGNVPTPTDYTKGLDTEAAHRNAAMGVDWAAYDKSLEEMRRATNELQDDMAKKAREAAEETRNAWASGLGSIGGSFVSAALDGKKSFGEMAESMLKDIAMLTLKMAALRAIQGGGAGAVAGNFLTGILGGANGFDYVANHNRLQLPGFATGGSFTVGGSGGTDSKIAMFRVTPGESVHVRTPQQQQYEASRLSPGGVTLNVIAPPSDPGEVTAAFAGNSGDKVVARWKRKYDRRRLG